MIGIGDYDGKSRNTRHVRTREDQVMFMGKKYRRDKKTGYMVCTSGKRQRLHVAMWEAYWGREVPRGCVIHHLDWNKTHNEISNLICVTVEEHETIHNKIGGEAGKRWGYELIKTRGVDGCPGGVL